MAKLSARPAQTCCQLLAEPICTGMFRVMRVPSPSWPAALPPHPQSVPSARMARLWSYPAEILFQLFVPTRWMRYIHDWSTTVSMLVSTRQGAKLMFVTTLVTVTVRNALLELVSAELMLVPPEFVLVGIRTPVPNCPWSFAPIAQRDPSRRKIRL